VVGGCALFFPSCVFVSKPLSSYLASRCVAGRMTFPFFLPENFLKRSPPYFRVRAQLSSFSTHFPSLLHPLPHLPSEIVHLCPRSLGANTLRNLLFFLPLALPSQGDPYAGGKFFSPTTLFFFPEPHDTSLRRPCIKRSSWLSFFFCPYPFPSAQYSPLNFFPSRFFSSAPKYVSF